MAISQSFFNLVNNKKHSFSTESWRAPISRRTNRIIYSNEIVKDLKILRNCNTLESLDNFIENRISEIEALEQYEANMQAHWRDVAQKAMRIQRTLSAEAAEMYFYSLEAMPDVKGAMHNAGDMAKKIFEKLFSLVTGFGKRIVSWVNTFFLGQANKFYEKFPLAQFTNMDAEVNAVKLPDDIVSKMEKSSSDEAVTNLRNKFKDGNMLYAQDMIKYADQVNPNQIFKLIFGEAGEKGMPKKQKMTVSQFFNGIQAGNKPALLEVLSPKMKKLWQDDMQAIKELGETIRKAISETQKDSHERNRDDGVKKFNESIKGLRMALAKMQARRFNDFNAKAKIAMMVYSVAKRGIKGSKKEEKK